MSTKVEISHIGAIEHLGFELPEGGGVLVARGTHGSGKSTLVKAVGARLGGDTSGLEPSDGRKKGELSIDHNGSIAKLTVRPSSKRSTGSLEVASIEGRFDLSMLIDPGYKDLEANELARLKALIGLMGNVKVGLRELLDAANVPDTEGIPDDVGPEPLDMVAKLKRFCEARARSAENDVRSKESSLKTLGEQLDKYDELPDEPATPDELAKMLADSYEQQRQQSVSYELWKKQAESVANARRQIEELSIEDDAYELQEQLSATSTHCDRLQLEIDDLSARLQKLKVEREHLSTRLYKVKEAETRRATISGLIKPLEDEPPQIPTSVFLDQRGDIQRRHNVAIAYRQRNELLENLEAAKSALKLLIKRSEAWRQSAKSLWPFLFGKIDGVEHLAVFDDELVTATDRSDREPLRELSAGERALIAIDVAVNATEPPALLTIRQEIWDGLNSPSRSAIASRCKERGCWILTAAIDDGPLTVEEQTI